MIFLGLEAPASGGEKALGMLSERNQLWVAGSA
jgi:hypothetical protein